VRLTALFGLALLVASALAVTAAAGLSAEPSRPDSVLHVGWTAEPDNLNPFIGYETSAVEVFHLNYDLLVEHRASDLRPVPGLATTWTHSADGRIWTFRLRRGVRWHDGVPFTAADVVFTFEYIMRNKLANFIDYTEGIESVEAVDDHTVRFVCSEPKANMLGMMVWIVPKHIWSKVSPQAAAGSFRNSPPIVGTGPFQVQEWSRGEFVRLKANPDYWRGAPKVHEVVFALYQNADTMAQDLRSHALQVAWDIPSAQFRQIGETPGLASVGGVVNGFTYLGFNCYTGAGSLGSPVLRDWRFRNALNYAVDKQRICTVAYDDHATPATTIIRSGYYPASLDWHWQPPADRVYGFDLAKANALLDAAGYGDSDGDGTRDHAGRPIALRLYARSESAAELRVARLVAGWFTKLGLRIDLEVMDEAAIFDRIYNYHGDTFTPDYDLLLWYWDSEPDPNFILSVLTSGQVGWGSDTQWSDPRYDRLYARQQTTMDQQARKQVVWRMQEVVLRQSPYIPLTYPQWLEGFNTGQWRGWVRSPADVGPVIYSMYNVDTYLSVEPFATAPEADGARGTVIAALMAVVAIASAIVLILVWRRRRHVEEIQED